MSDNDIQFWIETIKPGDYKNVLYYYNGINWQWSRVNAENHRGKWIDEPEYQGEVKVTPEDIEMYYLKKSADKYNL